MGKHKKSTINLIKLSGSARKYRPELLKDAMKKEFLLQEIKKHETEIHNLATVRGILFSSNRPHVHLDIRIEKEMQSMKEKTNRVLTKFKTTIYTHG